MPAKSNRRLKRKPPGPSPSITLAVVQRVAERVGRGLTLRLALAAEQAATVNEETWKKALAAHPELQTPYEAGKALFLAEATRRLAQSEELANLRWLLERRHSDLFAKREPDFVANVSVGLPPEVVERARKLAGKK